MTMAHLTKSFRLAPLSMAFISAYVDIASSSARELPLPGRRPFRKGGMTVEVGKQSKRPSQSGLA